MEKNRKDAERNKGRKKKGSECWKYRNITVGHKQKGIKEESRKVQNGGNIET